jgi:hypothetical protein
MDLIIISFSNCLKDAKYTSITIEVRGKCSGVCEKDAILRSVVCVVMRGWLYACVVYCNSPLNHKNIDYHFSVDFSRIGFPYKSLCQLCDYCSWFNLGFIFFVIKSCYVFLLPLLKNRSIRRMMPREDYIRPFKKYSIRSQPFDKHKLTSQVLEYNYSRSRVSTSCG